MHAEFFRSLQKQSTGVKGFDWSIYRRFGSWLALMVILLGAKNGPKAIRPQLTLNVLATERIVGF